MIKSLVCLVALLASLQLASASIPTQTTWEVRPTVGASTNGGGFVQGASGTDMSVFNNKNAAGCTSCQSATVNISTVDGVANGSTTYTSATGNFSSLLPGNIVYFSGGTGSIAAVRRQVVTFTNSTTIVLDASIAASTGMTMNIGGSLSDIADAITANTLGNVIWVKDTGTLVRTATLTLNNGSGLTNSIPPNQIRGYTSTRGDGGKAHIQASTNSGISLLKQNGASGWWYRDLDLDCNNLATCIGIDISAQSTVLLNLKISGWKTAAVFSNGGQYIGIYNSEFSNASSCTAALYVSAQQLVIKWNYIHDLSGSCSGIVAREAVTAEYNILDTITGATADGITNFGSTDITGSNISNNSLYNIGSNCITAVATDGIMSGSTIRGNICDTAGNGVGQSVGAGVPAMPWYDGNAFFNISGSNRVNLDDVGGTNPIYASAPYTNIYDVTLSVSPYVDAANANFTLNSTAGGGASLRGTSPNPTFPGLAVHNYQSFGAVQPQFGQTTGSSNVGIVQ